MLMVSYFQLRCSTVAGDAEGKPLALIVSLDEKLSNDC